jgi:hypothetical protein
VLVGATATLTVTATGSSPINYQWQFNGANLPGATSNTLVLNSVTKSHAGQYRVKVSNVAGSVTSAPAALTVNYAPVAVNDNATAAPNQTARLLGAKLLRNDWDLDGEALTIGAVSPQSERGGTVELSEGNVFYTPPAGFTGADHFTYTISDGQGATAVATVTVQVAAPAVPVRMVSPVAQLGGAMLLKFRAIPTRSYLIQASTNLSDWTTIATVLADSQGLCLFLDTAAPLYPGRYYRTKKP